VGGGKGGTSRARHRAGKEKAAAAEKGLTPTRGCNTLVLHHDPKQEGKPMTTKIRSIRLSDEVYRALKKYAGAEGRTIDAALRGLLPAELLSLPKPCKAHFEWTKQLVKIGTEQGEEAALTWMEENPYQPDE
jgi:hypothetical protein